MAWLSNGIARRKAAQVLGRQLLFETGVEGEVAGADNELAHLYSRDGSEGGLKGIHYSRRFQRQARSCPRPYSGPWIEPDRPKEVHQVVSCIDDRHRASPARGSTFDFDRETGHGKTGRWQLLEIVQLFRYGNSRWWRPGLVALPNQARIFRLGVSLRGVNERRVPAPASMPVNRTPRSSRCIVASYPMPQPEVT